MDLKQTKKIMLILAVAAVLCLVLAYITLNLLLLGLTWVPTIGVLVVNHRYWRCPCCGEHLGRDVKRYCTHCGKELEL